MPKVTVLMAVYNGKDYLSEAVDSIFGQTLRDFEFLIIDDGSTDGCGEWLDTLSDSRVRVIHQENQGLGAALNRGIMECRTPYLARMDADDISERDRLEKLIAFMEMHPATGMLGSRFDFIGRDGRRSVPPPLPLRHERIVKVLRSGGHAISHPTIVFRTDALRSVGGYHIAGPGQDWDVFHRISEKYRCANLGDVLYHMRLYPESTSWNRAMAVQVGLEYALYAAQCRRMNKAEPSLDEFEGIWKSRPFWRKLASAAEAKASRLYRQSVCDRLSGRPFMGRFRLACAASLCPKKTLLRILKSFWCFRNE